MFEEHTAGIGQMRMKPSAPSYQVTTAKHGQQPVSQRIPDATGLQPGTIMDY